MKLPNSAHTSQRWRILDIVPDFTLLDVWALPVHGRAEDFDTLLELMSSADPANADSLPARFVWRVRDQLGDWLGLDRISTPTVIEAGTAPAWPTIPGTNETTLADRLPSDLRDSARDVRFLSLPFVPLYRTDVEFAAELSNQTVYGVMHLAWVEQQEDSFQGQMAVYVKPRGRLGHHYMRLIEPFRQHVVYPALMRQIARTWAARASHP